MSTQNNEIQYPAITRSNAAGYHTVAIAFTFRNISYSFTMKIPNSLYEGAKESRKSALVPKSKSHVDWRWGYYEAFISDKSQEQLYTDLLSVFRKIRQEENLDSDEYLELLTTYVQSLPYDHAKIASKTDTPKYPVETIVENTGVCNDKSILLAALLSHEGYAVGLMGFDREEHMTVGIPVGRGNGYKNLGYAIIESTSRSYIGQIPEKLGGSGTLTSTPNIFPIREDGIRYGAFKDVEYIMNTQNELQKHIGENSVLSKEIEKLRKQCDKQKKAIEEKRNVWETYEKRINSLSAVEFEKYSDAVDTYNNYVEKNRELIDVLHEKVNRYNQMVHVSNFIIENVHSRKAILKEIKKLGW